MQEASSNKEREDQPLVFGGLTEKNIGQLKLLNTVVFPVNYNDTFYRDLLNDPALTRLALFNDVLVGAVCCRVENKTSGTGKRLYIMTLGVLAPYRKRQIGIHPKCFKIFHSSPTFLVQEANYWNLPSNRGKKEKLRKSICTFKQATKKPFRSTRSLVSKLWKPSKIIIRG